MVTLIHSFRGSPPITVVVSFFLGMALTTYAQAPLCEPPTNGLVSWWPAEGNASDMHGTNTAFLRGGVVYSPGISGSAFNFDGTTAAIEVADNATLGFASSATMMAWIKLRQLASSASHTMHIVGKSQVSNDLDLQVEPDNRVHFYVGPGLSVYSNPKACIAAERAR